MGGRWPFWTGGEGKHLQGGNLGAAGRAGLRQRAFFFQGEEVGASALRPTGIPPLGGVASTSDGSISFLSQTFLSVNKTYGLTPTWVGPQGREPI